MRIDLAWLPLLAFAYLVGSIPTGLWLGKLVAGVDVRQEGSHKTGATNVQRVVGVKAGVAVASLDVLKGVVAVLAVNAVTHDAYISAVAGVVAVAGHIWPILAGFDGGRGVSTTAGAVLALAPIPFFGAFLVMATVILLTRYVSLGSLAAAYALGPLGAIFLGRGPESDALLIVALGAGGLVALKHADNVHRLMRGSERRLGASKGRQSRSADQ
ncbi:MAG: glycerol-3-phosphate 1-O-acyltransferase PlsY [Candidatus Dormibacteria bacterium]